MYLIENKLDDVKSILLNANSIDYNFCNGETSTTDSPLVSSSITKYLLIRTALTR